MQSAAVVGMGATPLVRLSYGLRFAPVEVGLRLQVEHQSMRTVDTVADTTVVGLGASLGTEWALRRLDLRAWASFDEQWWRQQVQKQGVRTALVPVVGVGGGVRLPIVDPLFASAAVEALLHLPQVEGRGTVARPGVRGALGLGVSF
ncbi:MAG: hypothetical protein QM765_46870 [Myxococcales bacterium]